MKIEFILLIFFGIWLAFLTTMFFLRKKFFDNLVEAGEKKKLEEVLRNFLKKQENFEVESKRIEKKLDSYIEEGKLHVQKVGLIRFNPFKEIGGDHSFSLCVLDGNDDGFVITGLHTRERTRVYTKPIKKGKSKLSLADEEKKALESAIKNK